MNEDVILYCLCNSGCFNSEEGCSNCELDKQVRKRSVKMRGAKQETWRFTAEGSECITLVNKDGSVIRLSLNHSVGGWLWANRAFNGRKGR